MKEKKAYEHIATSREYLSALTLYPSYCELLNDQKEYHPLVNWILSFANRDDIDSKLPDLKVVASQADLPYSKIAKYLHNIYTDILELNWNTPLKFKNENESMYFLTFNYLGAYSYFNISLPVKPAIHEQVEFSFIYPKVGSRDFFVKSISHELVNGKQMIIVGLTYEIPNQYLKLLKEKAYLHHELDFMEYYGELDDESKEKLLKFNKGL